MASALESLKVTGTIIVAGTCLLCLPDNMNAMCAAVFCRMFALCAPSLWAVVIGDCHYFISVIVSTMCASFFFVAKSTTRAMQTPARSTR